MESTDSKSLNKNAGLLTMESTDSKNLNKTAGLMTMEPTGSQKPKSTTHTSVEEEEAFQKIMEDAEKEERQEISESMEKLILEEDMEINEENEEEQMEEGEINESEWAQSSSNWENPNKEESFANKAFENQEWQEALFGRPGTDDSVVGGDIPKELECVKSLNEEQQNTLSNWLHEGRGRLHYQQAPPGTGKTRLAAACIAAALKKDPKIAVLATANSNLPVSKLIDESAQINLGSEMLAFFASTARIRYGDQILLLNEHQLENKIKGKFVEKLEGSEKRDVTDYLAHIKDKPRHTKERKVGEIYLAREFKNAIFGTIYMCLGIPRAHVSNHSPHNRRGYSDKLLHDGSPPLQITTCPVCSLDGGRPSIGQRI
uniref:DNA2/NAM7 helicase helicase domain-containing protein n=1 Tax=Meloidogyne enterolobii TaxID=390850 RepID=A0A6V7WZH1_MELEN|nr:unnamed protein product [Meloidogyne enterolobii]